MNKNNDVLPFEVNGKEYESNEQYKTGKQIREIAGLSNSDDIKLFLAIKRPWEDELIEDDTRVDLSRPEKEFFYSKNILDLTINKQEFHSVKQYISGKELKELGGVDLEDELFLSIRKPWEDELISNDDIVNLARPGIEHFYSKSNNEVKLKIETSKGVWVESFNQQLKVEDLIAKIIAHFEFAQDGNYKLKIKETSEEMTPTRTIRSYHLPNGQVLRFTDLGKGA